MGIAAPPTKSVANALIKLRRDEFCATLREIDSVILSNRSIWISLY